MSSMFRRFEILLPLRFNIQFFTEFKEVLKSRFKQIDIWLTTFPVDVL